MLRYLGHVRAKEILALAAEEIQAKAAEARRDAAEIVVSGENWTCKIKKMASDVFKTEMTWTVEQTAVEAPAPKKRGHKKKPVAAAA